MSEVHKNRLGDPEDIALNKSYNIFAINQKMLVSIKVQAELNQLRIHFPETKEYWMK